VPLAEGLEATIAYFARQVRHEPPVRRAARG
jgi:hypothetical protein